MIKKIIDKLFNKPEIETVVDDDQDVYALEEVEKPYVGVPAPPGLVDDPWFGLGVQNEDRPSSLDKEGEPVYSEEVKAVTPNQESKSIHQEMYELATKNWTTIEDIPLGGSENFQEGPGHNASGGGWDQMRVTDFLP